MGTKTTPSKRLASRRSFLLTGLAVGAGAAGSGLLAGVVPAFAKEDGGLPAGDAAILRFLSALEILETDLWQQYNELGASRTPRCRVGAAAPPIPTSC